MNREWYSQINCVKGTKKLNQVQKIEDDMHRSEQKEEMKKPRIRMFTSSINIKGFEQPVDYKLCIGLPGIAPTEYKKYDRKWTRTLHIRCEVTGQYRVERESERTLVATAV